MGLKTFLDHTANVHRRTVTLGDAREEIRTWSEVLGDIAVGVRRPKDVVSNTGPGMAVTGMRVVYARPGQDIVARDVIEILTGPDSTKLLEVDGDPATPRGHHMEIRCRVYNGTLT